MAHLRVTSLSCFFFLFFFLGCSIASRFLTPFLINNLFFFEPPRWRCEALFSFFLSHFFMFSETCGRSVSCQGARLLGWPRRRFGCLGVVHMEEGVQVRVQVKVEREEQSEGETHGKGQNEEATRNKRSTAHHGWLECVVTRASRHLSHAM